MDDPAKSASEIALDPSEQPFVVSKRKPVVERSPSRKPVYAMLFYTEAGYRVFDNFDLLPSRLVFRLILKRYLL